MQAVEYGERNGAEGNASQLFRGVRRQRKRPPMKFAVVENGILGTHYTRSEREALYAHRRRQCQQ